MRLFGPLHISLLIGIAAVAALLAVVCRRAPDRGRTIRLGLGYGLAVNELIWWVFRYSREGVHAANLPLQLCDLGVWMTVLASITLIPGIVEFAYFAGLAGAGMALLTPDLFWPWPSYPALYFFVAHGGIVIAVAALVFGGIAPLRRGAVWRAFGLLAAYAAAVGAFNQLFGTNYMYLCRKPANASLLDALGPWPAYVFAGAGVALGLFWLLWLPASRAAFRKC